MDYESFKDLLHARHSTRRFTDRPVPKEVVADLIAAAQLAPSSCNHQLNRYVVITDPVLKESLCKEAAAPSAFREAPVSIALLFRMGWNHNKLSVAQSLGMSAQNILLAATSMGLESVIQAGIGDTHAIARRLGIGDGYFLASIISVGYGQEPTPAPPRLPTADVYSVNHFHEPPYLRYPRRPIRTTFTDYTIHNSPDAVWDPALWRLDSIAAFRGLAVWHTSPRPDVHRLARSAAEFDQEVAFFRRHLDPSCRTLEFLAYSGSYGARLAASQDLAGMRWEVLELSEHHQAFIRARCEMEGVPPPAAFHVTADFNVDLGVRFDRIMIPGSLNHLPPDPTIGAFLRRHLAPQGRILLLFGNRWSFEWESHRRRARAQVWNLGPYAPRSSRQIRRILGPGLCVKEDVGLSLHPWRLGVLHRGLTRALCRKRCLSLGVNA